MKIFTYIKQKGFHRALRVIWLYKLPKLQITILGAITRNRRLEDRIVIESHDDFDCNGGAFYDWLIKNGYNKKIKITWRLYHDIPLDLPENVSCVPANGPSWRKAWAVCTAKWLMADCSVEDKVRSDQISIYMTHGVFGIKNAHGLLDVPRSVDYVLSPSSAMDDTIAWYRGVDSASTHLVHMGYPELDKLYVGKRLSKVANPNKKKPKTILWMPTFRQGLGFDRNDSGNEYPYGVPLILSCKELGELSDILEDANVNLVIKLHPKQDLSHIDKIRAKRIEFITGDSLRTMGLDSCDLMLGADAMISDYSGAVFEYAVLDRPMAFVLADLDQYKLGLVPNAELYMPGERIVSLTELRKFIMEISNDIDHCADERAQFLDWFYEYHDEFSCERIAELLGMNVILGEDRGRS